MVRYIDLAIPPGMEALYNPIEDAAFMKQIGVNLSNDFVDETIVDSIYDLKNAATGATYELWWWGRKDSKQYFGIQKI